MGSVMYATYDIQGATESLPPVPLLTDETSVDHFNHQLQRQDVCLGTISVSAPQRLRNMEEIDLKFGILLDTAPLFCSSDANYPT